MADCPYCAVLDCFYERLGIKKDSEEFKKLRELEMKDIRQAAKYLEEKFGRDKVRRVWRECKQQFL